MCSCVSDLPPVRELNLLVKHVTLQIDQYQGDRGVGEDVIGVVGVDGWTWCNAHHAPPRASSSSSALRDALFFAGHSVIKVRGEGVVDRSEKQNGKALPTLLLGR